MATIQLPQDFRDFLKLLNSYEVEYLLVGGFAVGYHAKFALGDDQGAIVDYNKAIELNPNYDAAYNNRGLAKSDLGDNQALIFVLAPITVQWKFRI